MLYKQVAHHNSQSYFLQVFVYSTDPENFPKYDWDKITTIVEFGYHNDSLLCFAHSKQARVVFKGNTFTYIHI